MATLVESSIVPSKVNTPLDGRTVVANEAAIPSIALPYVGMHVYCTGNGKEYRITSLKAATINGVSVANAAVDSYEEITAGGEITYNGSAVSSLVQGNNMSMSLASGVLTVAALDPEVPDVGAGVVTILQGGVSKGSFNVNQSANASIELDAGGSSQSPVTYSGTTVSALEEGANVQMAIDGSGVLRISASDPGYASYGGSAVSSYAEGSNVTLNNAGGVLTIGVSGGGGSGGISHVYVNGSAVPESGGIVDLNIGSATITITQNGVAVGNFNVNTKENKTIALTAGGGDPSAMRKYALVYGG